MSVRDDKLGRIKVSPAAIAALVTEAVKECYGVVGMSSRSRLDDLAGSFTAALAAGWISAKAITA